MGYDVTVHNGDYEGVEVPRNDRSGVQGYRASDTPGWQPAESYTSYNVNSNDDVRAAFGGQTFREFVNGKTGREVGPVFRAFVEEHGTVEDYDPWSSDSDHVATQFETYAAWADVYPDAQWSVV